MEISKSELEMFFEIAIGLWNVSHGSGDQIQKNSLQAHINKQFGEMRQELRSYPESKELLNVVIAHVFKLQSSMVSDRAANLDAEKRNLYKELQTLKSNWADSEVVLAHYEELIATDEPEEPVNANLFVTIEYDGFITRHDLSRLLTKLDRLVEDEFVKYVVRESDTGRTSDEVRADLRSVPNRSFIGIAAIDHGSIELSVLASPDILKLIVEFGKVAAGYAVAHTSSGFNESSFPVELKRLGRNLGNVLAPVVRRFNDWIEKHFVPQIPKSSIRVKALIDEPKKRSRVRKPKSRKTVENPEGT